LTPSTTGLTIGSLLASSEITSEPLTKLPSVSKALSKIMDLIPLTLLSSACALRRNSGSLDLNRYIISAETLPVLRKVKHYVNYIKQVEAFKEKEGKRPLQ
jgi:hypothetical protein